MATMPWCPPKPGGRLPRPFCPFCMDLVIVNVNVDDQPTPDFSPNNFNCLLFVVAKLLNLCDLQLTSTRIRLTNVTSFTLLRKISFLLEISRDAGVALNMMVLNPCLTSIQMILIRIMLPSLPFWGGSIQFSRV